MELGKRIARRLKELGLTQMELARKSGLTQQAISQYIREKSKPGYDAIAALITALEVNPAWFFDPSQSGVPSTQETPTPQRRLHRTPFGYTGGEVIELPSTRDIVEGATFVIGHYFPMQQLPFPNQSRAGMANALYTLVFNSLTEYSSALLVRGALAIDWKMEDDRCLFWLRPKVQFHDGKPLTVKDVKWSYEQYLQSTPHESRIEGVDIVDEQVVAVYLKSQCPLKYLPMPYILPQGMGQSPDQWVGTGPFQPVELTSGFWRLQSNPHYFFGRPYFGEVHIREYPDAHALEAALIDGEVHFAIGINTSGRNLTASVEADVQRFHLHFLLKEPLVQNTTLRKAIALGLDREALAKAAGLREPRYSAGPFDYILNEHLSQPPVPPDPDTAKRLLTSIPGLADAVLRVKCYTSDPRERALEEALVEQLNRLGIRAQAGKPSHAVLVTRSAANFEVEHRIWASTSSFGYNFGYDNPEVDDLIRRCLEAKCPPHLLHQLRRLIQQDVPDIPLFYDEIPVTHVKQLQALESRVTLLSGLNDIHTWYLLDDDMAMRAQNRVVA